MFENKVPIRIFDPQRDKLKDEWERRIREIHIKKLSPYILIAVR